MPSPQPLSQTELVMCRDVSRNISTEIFLEMEIFPEIFPNIISGNISEYYFLEFPEIFLEILGYYEFIVSKMRKGMNFLTSIPLKYHFEFPFNILRCSGILLWDSMTTLPQFWNLPPYALHTSLPFAISILNKFIFWFDSLVFRCNYG